MFYKGSKKDKHGRVIIKILLTADLPWSENNLPSVDAVLAAVESMENGKATGPSGIINKM